MIAQVTGTITHKDIRFIVLSAHGVGYKVFVTGSTIEKLREGKDVTLWTYLAVREDALDLYGFPTKDEQDFFELLISISGIGPKSALGILNVASIKTLRQAVSSGDTSILTKVSGIGRKNAEKIVLELKGKFEATDEEFGGSMRDEADAIEALKSLGYGEREAREALTKVSKEIVGTGERVKQALKILK